MELSKCSRCGAFHTNGGDVCPKCAGKIQVTKSKKKRKFYICENNPGTCDYISWNKPKKEKKTAKKENFVEE